MDRRLNLTFPAYHHVSFDGVPTYRALAWALQDARNSGWHGTLVSSDRRPSVIREHNHVFHTDLHDQAYLSGLWQRYLRLYGRAGAIAHGVNPANPPTQGTHLLLGDGVVGRVGEHLEPYQLGLDVTEWDQLLKILHRLGYKVYQPYKTGSELHHLVFSKSPATKARLRLAHHAVLQRKKRARKA